MSSAIERVIADGPERLPAEVARYFLSLELPIEDAARSEVLAAKARNGSLTDAEQAEFDDLLTTNDLLMVLKSKARSNLPDGETGSARAAY